ncbi:hypothetical protein Pint_36338 [Pistacia integerrima]|uniref:Uncharacterized protein n=1 Tax=Pistacia integerrima TaxID=434235 RepID=A0ACC0Y1N1_9ROSI|nr:hypothetical protein Pint_36338 [Pistacia integerrima]
MDSVNAKLGENFTGRILVAALLATVSIIIFTTSSDFSTTNAFSCHETGVTHVLVTGGAGYASALTPQRFILCNYSYIFYSGRSFLSH